MIISLENFDEHGHMRPIINSPRSLEACMRQGIEPYELLIKTMADIKKLYHDGHNDKQSLQIKMEHYELRRGQKLEIVRQERMNIIRSYPKYQNSNASLLKRVVVKYVEDKLEKKKLIDYVRAEIKAKELYIKQIKVDKKIKEIYRTKYHNKKYKRQENYEMSLRAQKKKLAEYLRNEDKINYYTYKVLSKEEQAKHVQYRKREMLEAIKQYKQEKYERQYAYYKRIIEEMYDKKLQVANKYSYLYRRKQEKYVEYMMSKRANEEARIKDLKWKYAKMKEAEIEYRKRKFQMQYSLKNKYTKNEYILYRIYSQKERYYEMKRQYRYEKEAIVRERQEIIEAYRYKAQRVFYMSYRLQRYAEYLKRKQYCAEMRQKRYELLGKDKERAERLKYYEKQKSIAANYLMAKLSYKDKYIYEKRLEREKLEQAKILAKNLRLQYIQENKVREEKISEYEKQQLVKYYQEKIAKIEYMKEAASQQKIVIRKSVSKSYIENIVYKRDNSRYQISKPNPTAERVKSGKYNKAKLAEYKQALKAEYIANLVDNLRIQCSKYEYRLMKEEYQTQKYRYELYKTAENITELKRLQKIHAVYRARFHYSLNFLIKANLYKVYTFKKQLNS